MEPARVRLAEPAPPYCSGCFGAKPNMRHVDMGAAWDGPMLEPLKGAVGVIGHSIDDLVLCEDCIKAAAELVDLGNVEELREDLRREGQINAELHNRIHALEADELRLRETIASLREIDSRAAAPAPPIRPAGPRKPAGKRPTGPQRRKATKGKVT